MTNAFARWIARSGLRPADVARALGVSPVTIARYRRAGYWPEKRASAVRLWRFSGGAVSMDDMLADPYPASSEEYQLACDAMRDVSQRKGKGYAPRKKTSTPKKRRKRKEAKPGDSAGRGE